MTICITGKARRLKCQRRSWHLVTQRAARENVWGMGVYAQESETVADPERLVTCM